MRDLFILLGHLLIAVTKILRPGGVRAIVGRYSSCQWLHDWQFAMHTSPIETTSSLAKMMIDMESFAC